MRLIDDNEKKAAEDYAYAIQYIETLDIQTEEDVWLLIDNLKSERAIIHHQIGVRSAEAKNKDCYDHDFAEWKIKARKAIEIKAKQLRWIKQYCFPELKKKREDSVWGTCIILADYITSLPEDVEIPNEIKDRILKFRENLRRKKS
jgi:hypothetical protein